MQRVEDAGSGWGGYGGEGGRRSLDDRRLQALLEHSTDIITVIDSDRRIIYASPASGRVLGYPQGANAGADIVELVHPDDRERVLDAFREVLGAGEDAVRSVQARIRRVTGEWCHLESVASNHINDPAVRGVIINSRDVTERIQAMEEIHHRAYHDALTGLPNRNLLLDRMVQALARAERSGADIVVLFVDLDGFKAVNDHLGHAQGDEVLREVARRLTASIRPADTASRIGGDELVVMAEGLHVPTEAVALAERIIEAVGRPFEVSNGTIEVQASVGISTGRGGTPDELLDRADRALYEVKRHGGGSWYLAGSEATPRIKHD